MVEWLERLGYSAEVAVKREFEARPRHAAKVKSLCQPSSKRVRFYRGTSPFCYPLATKKCR